MSNCVVLLCRIYENKKSINVSLIIISLSLSLSKKLMCPLNLQLLLVVILHTSGIFFSSRYINVRRSTSKPSQPVLEDRRNDV